MVDLDRQTPNTGRTTTTYSRKRSVLVVDHQLVDVMDGTD